jgi:hypothetical protein
LKELYINEYFINYDNMKNKFLSLIFVVAIAIVAVWNFSRNQNEIVLADLALENVEALAAGEEGGGGHTIIYRKSFCSNYNMYYKCALIPSGEDCGGRYPDRCP